MIKSASMERQITVLKEHATYPAKLPPLCRWVKQLKKLLDIQKRRSGYG